MNFKFEVYLYICPYAYSSSEANTYLYLFFSSVGLFKFLLFLIITLLCVRGIKRSASARHGKVTGSMLGSSYPGT